MSSLNAIADGLLSAKTVKQIQAAAKDPEAHVVHGVERNVKGQDRHNVTVQSQILCVLVVKGLESKEAIRPYAKAADGVLAAAREGAVA